MTDEGLTGSETFAVARTSGGAARTLGDDEPVRYWYDWAELWGDQPRL